MIDGEYLVWASPERKLTPREILERIDCVDLLYENACTLWPLPETCDHDRSRLLIGDNELCWLEFDGRTEEERQQQLVALHQQYGLDWLDEVWDSEVLGRKYLSMTRRDFETIMLMCDTQQGRRLRQLFCHTMHLVKLLLDYEDKWREHAEQYPDVYEPPPSVDGDQDELFTQMRYIAQDYDTIMLDLFHCTVVEEQTNKEQS